MGFNQPPYEKSEWDSLAAPGYPTVSSGGWYFTASAGQDDQGAVVSELKVPGKTAPSGLFLKTGLLKGGLFHPDPLTCWQYLTGGGCYHLGTRSQPEHPVALWVSPPLLLPRRRERRLASKATPAPSAPVAWLRPPRRPRPSAPTAWTRQRAASRGPRAGPARHPLSNQRPGRSSADPRRAPLLPAMSAEVKGWAQEHRALRLPPHCGRSEPWARRVSTAPPRGPDCAGSSVPSPLHPGARPGTGRRGRMGGARFWAEPAGRRGQVPLWAGLGPASQAPISGLTVTPAV